MAYLVYTNALTFDGTWHNATIVQLVTTNLDKPVIDATQFLPSGGVATIVWSSVPLDSAFGNDTNQVNTNQVYIIERALKSPVLGRKLALLRVCSRPGRSRSSTPTPPIIPTLFIA